MRHLRIYKALDAVARHRSIRAAAYGLAISPSALNRQVQALEDDLGVGLFERLPRGVRLSTAGEIYLGAFRAHIAELDRAAAQINDLAGLRAGAVRLGVGPELVAGTVRKITAAYRADFPDLDIEIAVLPCDGVGEALRSFDVDLYVGANPVLDETVDVLHSEEAAAICVGAAAESGGGPIRLSDLANAPLAVNSAASGLRRLLDAAFAARSVPVRYAMVADQLDPDIVLASPEINVVTISHGQAATALNDRSGGGRRVDARDLPALFIKVLRLKSRALPIGATRLAERIIEAMEQHPE